MYFNKFYFVLIILNFKYIIYININIIKKFSETGARTPVICVTGKYTNHYTISEKSKLIVYMIKYKKNFIFLLFLSK